MSRKKSRRQRYVEHWLGPAFWKRRRSLVRNAKAGTGRGDLFGRYISLVIAARYTSFVAFKRVKP